MSLLCSSWKPRKRKFSGMSLLCAALPGHPKGTLVSQPPRTALAVLVLSLAQDPAPAFQPMTLQWLWSR